MLKVKGPSEERWKSFVSVESPGCWIWTGTLDRNGYGVFETFGEGRKSHRAHRWVYRHLVGGLPQELSLDHLCRVHSCVNPEHLQPVTHAENVARGVAGARYFNRDYCKHGHEFTPENTRVKSNGRVCLACIKTRNAQYYQERRNPDAVNNADKTHCSNGHEFDEKNTYLPPRGGRSCRECTRAKVREYMRKKRAAAKT